MSTSRQLKGTGEQRYSCPLPGPTRILYRPRCAVWPDRPTGPSTVTASAGGISPQAQLR